jgi:hypothetical protein
LKENRTLPGMSISESKDTNKNVKPLHTEGRNTNIFSTETHGTT